MCACVRECLCVHVCVRECLCVHVCARECLYVRVRDVCVCARASVLQITRNYVLAII